MFKAGVSSRGMQAASVKDVTMKALSSAAMP
jgi:hypothetical protein